MPHLSQNKKIALSALAIFIMSFAFMLFFLDEKIMNENTQEANVFEAGGHGGETKKVAPEKEAETVKKSKKAEPKEESAAPMAKPIKEEGSHRWMETIYPKIKELEDFDSGRLMVDKIF